MTAERRLNKGAETRYDKAMLSVSSLLSPSRDERFVPAMRHPFSRMIVAVDRSKASARAVQLAISLASGAARTELVFVHAIDIPRMIDRLDSDYCFAFEAARKEARSVLDASVAAAARARVFARTCLRYGKAASEVAAVAALYAADLVVIGNDRSDPLLRLLYGSVRDDIVRTSAVPVLVAEPHGSDPPEFRRPCVLAHQSAASGSVAALRLSAQIARAYDWEMVCLPVAKRDAPAAARALERAAYEHQPALVVIGPPPPRMRDRLVPNVVERTLQIVDAPVLVVRS